MTQPLGAPPAHFDAESTELWKEIETQAPEGVLERSDRSFVELIVFTMRKVRGETATAGDYSRLLAMLGKCGMTPKSRARLLKSQEAKQKKAQRKSVLQ